MGRKKIIAAAVTAALLIPFCKWQNDALTVAHVDYANAKIEKDTAGFRILHISDLHNKNFGRGQKKIVDIIRGEDPDIIVITGDLVDCMCLNLEIAMQLIREMLRFAPVCYVAGNHELRLKEYKDICRELKEAGVTVLENESVKIPCGEKGLRLIGLPDPSAISNTQGNFKQWVLDRMENVIRREMEEGVPNILLIHRPELLELYAKCGLDLVFCGHAHGGQIRIPGLGGIIAPNQGFFPRYTEGVHRRDKTTMVVSRGIGNSRAPQRLWNRPELIVVTLKQEGGRE